MIVLYLIALAIGAMLIGFIWQLSLSFHGLLGVDHLACSVIFLLGAVALFFIGWIAADHE